MILMAEREHPIREAEQRRIRDLEQEIADVRSYLDRLEKQLAIACGANLKYSGMRIKTALLTLLEERGVALPQSEIEEELEIGGVVAGKRQPKSQIGKSIDRLLRVEKPEIKKHNGKIGRAEWGDERFR